jgi:methyl-accepting chemotaxis protein
MTRFLFLFVLLFSGATTVPADQPPAATATRSPGAGPVSGRTREGTPPPSLWDDSKKFIEQGGWDVGGWIAERRALLAQSSVLNPYFSFSVVSLLLITFLVTTVYFQKISEDRKIWKATGVMTDLWNWALYADWQARQTIHKYNVHIDQYNRLVDLQLSGKAPTSSHSTEEFGRLQTEVESMRQDKTRLEQAVAERERTIQVLSARVDEIAKQVDAGASRTDTKVQVQLMEKVNQLSSRNQQLEQQLADAQQKLAPFTGEKATRC